MKKYFILSIVLVFFGIHRGANAQAKVADFGKMSNHDLVVMLQSDQSGDWGGAMQEIMFRGKNKDIVSELIKVCAASASRSKVRLIEILRKFRAQEAIPCLEKMLDSKNEEMATALRALRTIQDPNGVPRMTALYHQVTEPRMKAAVVYTLGFYKPVTLIPEFKKDLDSPEETLKFAAARALAQMDDWSGRPAILEMASKKNPYYKYRAIGILGEMGNPQDAPFLEKVDKEVPNERDVKMALFQMMVKITPDKEKIGKIIDYLDQAAPAAWKDPEDFRSRYEPITLAIELLGKDGSPAALKQLEKMINDNRFWSYQMELANALTLNGKKLTWAMKTVMWGGVSAGPGLVFEVK